jgi:hypothetical protein
MEWKYIRTGTHANTMLGQRVTESLLAPPQKLGLRKRISKDKNLENNFVFGQWLNNKVIKHCTEIHRS